MGAMATKTADRSVPAWRRAIKAIRVVSVLLLVTLVPYILLGRAYAAGHRFVTPANRPLAVSAVAGERVWIGIRVDQVIGQHYETGGLTLTLDGRRFPLVPPHGADWGEITRGGPDPVSQIAGKLGALTLGSVITIPAGVDRTGRITGTISGGVTYPTSDDASVHSYKGVYTAIDTPVTITVLNRGGEPLTGAARLFLPLQWICLALAGLLVGAALFACVGSYRYLGRRVRALQVLSDVLMGVFIGGVLAGLGVLVAHLAERASGLGASMVPWWLLPALLGVGAMVRQWISFAAVKASVQPPDAAGAEPVPQRPTPVHSFDSGPAASHRTTPAAPGDPAAGQPYRLG
jgi:hypothetical protein